jgi:hypothetical protein
MIVVEASQIVTHGRPRDVLAHVERWLAWQDGVIAYLQVEIDGVWYVPAWVFEG